MSRLVKTLQDALSRAVGQKAMWGYGSEAVKIIATALNEDFVLIPKADLPVVTQGHSSMVYPPGTVQDSSTYYAGGENFVFTSEENARKWVLGDVAVWQYIRDRRVAEEKQRMVERRATDLRRVKIALDLGVHRSSRAVQRIIELEDELAAAKGAG